MENTSYISEISYKIETWKLQGLNNDNIKYNISELQKNDEFPTNLEYIDSYTSLQGSSGCAFKDKNTGEVIVGFAGTNPYSNPADLAKDVAADVKIGLVGMAPDSLYLTSAKSFVNRLQNQGYSVNQVTGHSLGGPKAVAIAVEYNIPICVTFKSAYAFTMLF